MIKIKLDSQYKSLAEFEAICETNFCVITGKNGSGKTQLLECIEQYKNRQNRSVFLNVDSSKIQTGSLSHPNLTYLDSSLWTAKISELWSQFVSKIEYNDVIEKILKVRPELSFRNTSFQELEKIVSPLVGDIKKAMDRMNYFHGESTVPDSRYIDLAVADIYDRRVALDVAVMVARKAKKKLGSINNQDFVKFPPTEDIIDKPHLFFSSLESIFYGYGKRRHLNWLHWCSNQYNNTSYVCQSDDDFCAEFQPPWKNINNIFEKHKLNYAFQEILPAEYVDNTPIDFRLIKRTNGQKIEFANLSSGEKVIIALICKLFISDYYQQKLDIPELIVLDEPDAHLHPELTKLLIDVLSGTFVKDLGVKVIITTHSPSTVALAPEESLYEMKNDPLTALIKISKDEALKILTHEVPTLTLDYENHRQVFVESPTDSAYYRLIHAQFAQQEQLTYSPYFISYSKGKGNCAQVIKLVSDLRNAGNKKVFGIIDWDTKNKGNTFIFVHGEGTRWSIENFLYDPVYLVILFIHLEAENICEELNISGGCNYYDLGTNSSAERLQEMSDWIIRRITNQFPNLNDKETKSVHFYNGKTLNVPTWYIEMQGHSLEEKLKKVFKSLEGKFRNEGSMQEELTKIIVRCYPFWPEETVGILKNICK